MMPLVDLRSDTITKPTAEMRRAMADADVGDDVYGEDPTVRALEERAGEVMGKAAAMFVPSGTMGNACAVLTHAHAGQAAIMDAECHIYVYEQGGVSALGGILPILSHSDNGVPAPVDNADYIEGARLLEESAVTVLEAARNQDYDAASFAVNFIVESCSHCHRTYRDGPDSREELRCQ